MFSQKSRFLAVFLCFLAKKSRFFRVLAKNRDFGVEYEKNAFSSEKKTSKNREFSRITRILEKKKRKIPLESCRELALLAGTYLNLSCVAWFLLPQITL